MLALPFLTPLGSGVGKHFAVFYVLGFLWGVWRVAYFDPVTQNDVPGIGYLIVPLVMGGISASVFLMRVWLHGQSSSSAS
jgi:hypothetical protein